MSRGQIQNIPADAVYLQLQTRPAGLRDEEVASRLAEIGPNALESRARWQWVRTLGRQLINFFTLLLDLSAAICFVADYMQPGEGMNILGWALLGVSLLNAMFAFIQENRAERAMEALRKFLPQQVLVQRGGDSREVLAEELVPGDVLLLEEGNRVPADARLVETTDLMVNNAPLTGESKPLPLVATASDETLLEAENVVFAGCSVLRGTGRAVVFATGPRTEFGKIAALSQDIRRTVSPLERETGRMVRVLTIVAVVMGVLFFAYGVFAGRSLWVNLVFMLGIIVANVPEGLLPTFTLSLAMGSVRMARKNVLVKGLNAVEAMGALHVICTDKTGTLTLNSLSITHVTPPTQAESLDAPAETALLRSALVASDVRKTHEGFGGDPLDVAVAERLVALGDDGEALLRPGGRHYAFDVRRRREAGLLLDDPAGPLFVVKGAWESLRPLISRAQQPGSAEPVAADEALLAKADDTVFQLASQGLRVIAVAQRRLPVQPAADTPQEAMEQDLVLLGFMGLEDPLRPEVPDAVARCHTAGIRVLLVTGDHPDTAEAIARKAGILADGAEGSPVLTGQQLERMREDEIVERLEAGVVIFARTTPEQKMKIVLALKRMGLVVGMTGDGVNDAPALKAADVGISMGRRGTDVAREASQIILLDDNFASIVNGVAEGRTIFRNVQKFTNYVLVSNGPEIIPFLVYIVFPVPLALGVIQILSIDLGTDIVPSMALGQEPADRDVMQQPPRRSDDRLLNLPVFAHSYLFLGLIEAGWSMFLFFLVLVQGGWQYGQDLTASDPLYRSALGIALASIMLMQIGNLVGRRSPRGSGIDWGLLRNRLIVAGVVMEVTFACAVLYFPPVQAIIGTGPVNGTIFALAWLGVPLIFGADYLRKLIFRFMENRQTVATAKVSTA